MVEQGGLLLRLMGVLPLNGVAQTKNQCRDVMRPLAEHTGVRLPQAAYLRE